MFSPRPRTGDTFTTELPAFVDPGLETFLIDHGVEISAVPIHEGSAWSTLLFGFGPAILIIGFYVWLYCRAQQVGGMGLGGIMGIGRSKARRYTSRRRIASPSTTLPASTKRKTSWSKSSPF